MNDELKSIKNEVTSQHEAWEKRTGKKKNAPFLSDSPCYYCQFNRFATGSSSFEFACKYCIHNPEAIIWDLADATND